jgi:hypothetical protein
MVFHEYVVMTPCHHCMVIDVMVLVQKKKQSFERTPANSSPFVAKLFECILFIHIHHTHHYSNQLYPTVPTEDLMTWIGWLIGWLW